MEVVRNLCNYSYVLANRKSFFHRFCDSGFKNKWTGFWAMPYKIFDYFAVRTGDIWLSPENIVKCDYDGRKVVSEYDVNGKKVTETIILPKGKKAVIIKIKGAKDLYFEIGFNMRKREENWHERDYKVEKNKIKGLTKAEIKGGEILDSYYKEHSPKGEKQRCFVVVVKAKNTLTISADKGVVKESEYEKEKKVFSCDNTELEEAFKWMAFDIELLYQESKYGSGFFAGYPWFTMFWGRDSGWMIPAATRLGMFDEAKSVLKALAENSKDRIVNYFLTDGSVDEDSIDATLLWVIALHDYVYNSGDIEFLKKMEEKLKLFMHWYFSNTDENGFPEHDLEKAETWMDTFQRKGAIDIAVLWIRALECYSDLLFLLGETNSCKEVAEEQKRKLDIFWDEEKKYYKDSLDSERITANPLFVLYFGIENHAGDVLSTFELKNLNTDWGVRSLSNTDLDYNPNSYHKGNIWGFLTALAGCVELKYGKRGMEYLKMLIDNINECCIGGTNEVWNGDTKRPEGCCIQGWNASLFINAIDDFMLGIKVDALKDEDAKDCITVEPKLPEGINRIKRRRRVKDRWVEITVERKEDEIVTEIREL